MAVEIQWIWREFDALSLQELYQLLQLRCRVFIVEQTCPFLDVDDNDQHSQHLLGYAHDGQLAAYGRIIIPQHASDKLTPGRFVTAPEFRGCGIGKELLEQTLAYCAKFHQKEPLWIGAQLYLKRFYESFGFVQQGDVYVEDNIDHIHMLKQASV